MAAINVKMRHFEGELALLHPTTSERNVCRLKVAKGHNRISIVELKLQVVSHCMSVTKSPGILPYCNLQSP